MSVDGTFLTSQFKGTLFIAVANDGGDKLVSLAFALVSAENNDNWEWFLSLVRTKVIRPQREVCIISDRHPGYSMQGRLTFQDILACTIGGA